MSIEDDLRNHLVYDPKTGHLIWIKPVGQKTKIGSLAGHVNKRGYAVVGFKGKHYKAHRVAWLIFYGYWPEYEIDHINGDRSDNRLINLRAASRLQNLANRKKQKKTSSVYKGVYWDKREKKWKCSIRNNGVKQHLGYFLCEKIAAMAYDNTAKTLYGDYAHLNFKVE